MMKQINHCSHCCVEADCAANGWCLYNSEGPCCPNMKEGREQFKQFLEDYFKDRCL